MNVAVKYFIGRASGRLDPTLATFATAATGNPDRCVRLQGKRRAAAYRFSLEAPIAGPAGFGTTAGPRPSFLAVLAGDT